MAKIPLPGFIGPSYAARYSSIDLQECINLMPEIENPASKNIIDLISTPGLKAFATLAGSTYSVRGLYSTSLNRLFAIIGNRFVEISTSGGATTIAIIYTNSGMCSITDNGNQLAFVDGIYGYTYDLVNWTGESKYNPLWDPLTNPTCPGVTHTKGTFAKITGYSKTFSDGSTVNYTGFPAKPTHIIFKDGFLVVNRGGTGEFYISESYEAGLWDPLQYATAEASPDKLLAITRTSNEIFLIGDKCTEIWYNSGQTPFPFQRVTSAVLDIGTASKYSVATNGSNVFVLGSNVQGQGIVYCYTGYAPQRISTHSIEFLIGQIGKIDDAVGWCYQQEGHSFYVLNFITGNRTFVYDLSTGSWHERGYYNKLIGYNDRHRGICAVNFNQKVYVGDWQLPKVYELDLGTYTDAGNTIMRRRTCPHLNNSGNRIYYYQLELLIQKGAGLA